MKLMKEEAKILELDRIISRGAAEKIKKYEIWHLAGRVISTSRDELGGSDLHSREGGGIGH